MTISKKIFILVAAAFALPGILHAATLGITASNAAPDIGQPVRIDIPLDTQGDNANAIQGQIIFPSGQFILRNIDDGGSPVNFWVEAPEEIASGVVEFSGIIPGGFQGAASSVVSLWLLPTASGNGQISLSDVELLRNDGEATPITTVTGTVMIAVSTTNASSTPTSPTSFVTPESFTPVISQDPNIYGGKYFLAFSTTDKGSGIDHYEVLEVSAGGSGDSWQVATSPYLLQDQALESTIYVRAVDHAGNFIVVEVPATNPAGEHSRRIQNDVLLVVLCLLLILIILLARMLLKRKKV
jgi:hypothetical protein